MKKINYILLFLLLAFIPQTVKAENTVTLHLFHLIGCHFCEEEKVFLETLKTTYPNLEVIEYEIGSSDEDRNLLAQTRLYFKTNMTGVPYTVIGETGITGFSDSIGENILSLIEKCSQEACTDVVTKIKNGEIKVEEEKKEEEKKEPEEEKENSGSTFWMNTLAISSVVVVLLLVSGILYIAHRKRIF